MVKLYRGGGHDQLTTFLHEDIVPPGCNPMIGEFLELAIYDATDFLIGKTSLLGVNWLVKASSITWITGGI